MARVIVPDDRYDFLCDAFKPKSCVPAVLAVTDIAGLVKGAAEGEGLGNAFLSHISATDALYMVVRCFSSVDIEHVEGSVEPTRDLDIIAGELRQKDIAQVKGALAPLLKGAGRTSDKQKKAQYEMLEKIREHLESGKDIRYGCNWSVQEVDLLNTLQLLTAKPVVVLANISLKNFRQMKNKWLKSVMAWAKEHSPGSPVIPYSAAWEELYAGMDEEARKKECEENKVISMMPRIIRAGYSALGLQNFFTAGKDEVRAWTVRKGSKAPQAAGVIHTDFEKGFICADTMSYDDFKELGSENAVKAAGKMRMEGKNYMVQDGDIFHFKFNT